MIVRRDFIAGATLLIVGVAYGFLASALPNRTLPNTPGPAFFPWLITGGLVLLSAALLARAIKTRATGSPATAPDARASRGPWALILFACYITALPYAGFLASSVPFFAALMWLYGERNRLSLTLGAILVPVCVLFLFRGGFQILLPVGAW